MEYYFQVGEKWGDSVAPVATRFITSHDLANSQVRYLETFFDNVAAFNPDLIVLSGKVLGCSENIKAKYCLIFGPNGNFYILLYFAI